MTFGLHVLEVIAAGECRESYCGPGIRGVWRGFHGDLLDTASDAFDELPQLPDGGAPELIVRGSACGARRV